MSDRSPRNRVAAYAIASAFVAGVLLETAVLAYKFAADPSFVFLVSSHGAQWIREPRPMEIALLAEGIDTTTFEKRFTVITPPLDARLHIRALETATVYLDGQPIHADPPASDTWKRWREVDLTPLLQEGPHTLAFVVAHDSGPPFVQAYSESLGLFTGPDWMATRDGESWSAAIGADRIPPVPGSRAFPSAFTSLVRALPLLVVVFALGA